MVLRVWFWPAVAVVVTLNVAYTAWALSLPAHEGAPNTLFVDIPPERAVNATYEGVASQLEADGWAVEVENNPNRPSIEARLPGEPRYVVWIYGLEGTERPYMAALVSCNISYLATECTGNDRLELTLRVERASQASGLSADVAHARLDDNDFQTLGELVLFGVQVLLLIVSLLAILGLEFIARVEAPPYGSSRWGR